MTVILDAASIRAVTLGTLVSRAAAILPQSTDGALFTISGGRVVVNAIVGEVTTVMEAGANNTKLKLNPTAVGADQDLCATLSIASDAVGDQYTITGTVGDAMLSDLLIGNGVLTSPLVLSEGDIELDCSASKTGAIAWELIYSALDSDATVVAA